MKERPILFSGDMVRAILEGRKTQTRRAVKPQPGDHMRIPMLTQNGWQFMTHPDQLRDTVSSWRCPFGIPGDRLWVRETWSTRSGADGLRPIQISPNRVGKEPIWYKADGAQSYPEYDKQPQGKWRPSIHMPRWASRITLEITGVRVERLQDMSEEDARAEGIVDGGCLNCGEHEPCGCNDPQPDARDSFIYLWESIHGEDSWNANPWVWVIEFRMVI